MPRRGGGYVDNASNRSLGRVGMAYGKVPVLQAVPVPVLTAQAMEQVILATAVVQNLAM